MPPKKLNSREIIGIMVNKIFFNGGLKLKDALENIENARSLVSLLTYIQKNVNVNKPGTIKWFTNKKFKDIYFDGSKQIIELRKENFTKAQNILKELNEKIKNTNNNIVDIIQIIEIFANNTLGCGQKINVLNEILDEWKRLGKNKKYEDFKEEVENEIAGKKARKKLKNKISDDNIKKLISIIRIYQRKLVDKNVVSSRTYARDMAAKMWSVNNKQPKEKLSDYMSAILKILTYCSELSDLQIKLNELPKAKTKDDKIISKYISELKSIIEQISKKQSISKKKK